MEQGQELGKEAFLAFPRELVVEPPHAAAEDGEVVVHVFAWGHPAQKSTGSKRVAGRGEVDVPEAHAVVVRTGAYDEAFQKVGVDDVLHHFDVEGPFLLLGPVGRVRRVEEVSTSMVVRKGLGQTGGGFFPLAELEDPYAAAARPR